MINPQSWTGPGENQHEIIHYGDNPLPQILNTAPPNNKHLR